MSKINWKELTPYLVAVLLFLTITLMYFSPLLEGKKLRQHDSKMHMGMSKEIADHREKTEEEALWTNSMFGGMPAYQISVIYKGNLLKYIDDIFTKILPRPSGFLFLYFAGFFVLLISMRVNPWLAIIGAIAFGFSTYFLIIIAAGHNSKAHAIGYMAFVLAGVLMAYRGNWISGSIFTGIALSLQIETNHVQITYYLMMIIAFVALYYLIESINKKQIKAFVRTSALLLFFAMLAIATNITSLWATYEYGQTSIRGKSELTQDIEDKTSGLDLSYMTQWSYGIGESWTLMIPNAKGGATAAIGADQTKDLDRNVRSVIAQQNAYWGNQPFTSGPVYVGAVVVFFFVLGMFILPGRLKWALFAVSVLSVFLAWGKNWMDFTEFFANYIPGYNKFRTVSMTLVIAELCLPFLAFLTLNHMLKNPGSVLERPRYFWISFGLTGGIAVLFYLLPGTFFSFFSQMEEEQFRNLQAQGDNRDQIMMVINSLEQARINIFRADVLRSIFFISASALLTYLYGIRKIGAKVLLPILFVLVAFDLIQINRRYLNDDNYERKREVENPFVLTKASQEILKDNSLGYRVLDIAGNTFNDASTSYFHRSIGGYHGAKLKRYQELIDNQLASEISNVRSGLSNGGIQAANARLRQSSAINMLNTKYLIYNPNATPLTNPYAYGPAWFVREIKWVANADEEIKAVGETNLKLEAIVDERYQTFYSNWTNKPDTTAYIRLIEYAPNHLVYEFSCDHPQVAVFSEIYYDKGWRAYVNDEEIPIFRTNYILRGAIVPPGSYQLVFKFEPRVWVVGERISYASSIFLIFTGLGYLIWIILGRRVPE